MPPPYFKYTSFLSNIDQITFVNNDLFNFKKWISSSLDGSPYNSTKLFTENYIDVSENFELYKIDTNNDLSSPIDQYVGYLINNRDNNINLDSDFRYSLISTSDKGKINEKINENISNNNEYFILYILKDGSNSLLKFDVNNELIEQYSNVIINDILDLNNLFILNNKKMLEYDAYKDLIDVNNKIGLFNYRDSNSPFDDELIQYQEYINGENNVFPFAGYINGFSFSTEYYLEIKDKLINVFKPANNSMLICDILIDNGLGNDYENTYIECLIVTIDNVNYFRINPSTNIEFEIDEGDTEPGGGPATENFINNLISMLGFNFEQINSFQYEYLIMYSKLEKYSPNFKYILDNNTNKGILINYIPKISGLYNYYNSNDRSISITLTETGEGSDFVRDYTNNYIKYVLDKVINNNDNVLIKNDMNHINFTNIENDTFKNVSEINYQNYIDANRIAIDNSILTLDNKFFVIIDFIDYTNNQKQLLSNKRVRFVSLNSDYTIDQTYKDDISLFSTPIKDNIQNDTSSLKDIYETEWINEYSFKDGEKQIGAIIVNYSALFLYRMYGNVRYAISLSDNNIIDNCKIS
jgi:hypothetical protein